MDQIECYRGVVHPWMCDVMGHFTTRHYMAMFDDAAYHLFAAIGFRPDHLAAGVGIADLKTTLTYKAELRAGDLVNIRGQLVKMGEKSLVAHYEMVNSQTGVIAAEMEAVSVQFDLKERRAVSILKEIRDRTQQLGFATR